MRNPRMRFSFSGEANSGALKRSLRKAPPAPQVQA
jgi:hypothetical protein